MGKIAAREAFPGGPDLSITLSDMEEVAMRAARALVGSAVETAAGEQAASFGEAADCPGCGRSTPLEHRSSRGHGPRRDGQAGGTGRPLLDVSSRFFSLSVAC